MVKITKVSVLENYRLEVAFDDGVRGVVDLSDLVGKGVFTLWRDPAYFRTGSNRFIRRACLARQN